MEGRVREAWPGVAVNEVALESRERGAGGRADARSRRRVQLGALTPDDVAVELYHGPTTGGHEIARGKIVRMRAVGAARATATWRYAGEIPTRTAARTRSRRASCRTTRR